MRAVLYDRYGSADELAVREVPTPEPPKGCVRVKVHAAALNPKDSFVRKGRFKALAGGLFPKGLGYDFAGVVDAIGAGVAPSWLGASVLGMKNGFAGSTAADYAIVPLDEFARKPEGLSFEEAAAVPLVGLTALQALRDEGGVKAGSRVLVHGASGGVGVHAIQIARELGAHVTTTSSARNREHCRHLGSHETLDYAVDGGLSVAGRYDCVFDVFGNLSFTLVRRALAPGGTYVTTVPGPAVVRDRVVSWASSKRARLVVVRSNRADLEVLVDYMNRHRLRPIVDRMFPLGEAAAAQRYIETKRARGKVVLRVA
jgi:NADPH:quinone reductase-like Zn-dependent oxidoreductase